MGADIVVIYRTSPYSYEKERIETKKGCWINLVDSMNTSYSRVVVLADRITDEMRSYLGAWYIQEVNAGSNSASFLACLDLALTYPDGQIIYFLEDDYLHRVGWEKKLLEGLELFDVVTLYDHPDRYKYTGKRSVVLGKTCHWQEIPSTTLTFAITVGKLRQIEDTIRKWVVAGEHPNDHALWMESGLRLGSPIPGFATHTDTPYIAPYWYD